MEKLLHERLREHVDGFRFDLGGGMNLTLSQPQAIALADKIERYYIPLPRFEDGEPVEWGDEFDNGYGVSKLTNFQVGKYGEYYLNGYVEDPDIGLDKGEFVKRPVFDACGERIKTGDTVFDEKGKEHTVLEPDLFVKTQQGAVVRIGECDYICVNLITKERPVFDAEGVRILKGDTVYSVNGSDQLIVKEVFADYIEVEGSILSYPVEELTHREPDSLEKLRDDMDEYLNLAHEEAGIKNTSPLDCWVDRLTALIERGA